MTAHWTMNDESMGEDWVSIEKEIEFDAGHRVPKHNGKCRNPHGHRYRIVVQCRGRIINDPERSDNGMLIDFGTLKTIMMKRIHDVLDHKFIVWENDTPMREGLKVLDMTEQDSTVVFPYVPTAENIARWCWDQILPDIEGEFEVDDLMLCSVTVWETPTSRATYSG